MEEVLLGTPLLRTLGFDLERFLSANRNRLDNTDVSGLPSAEDKQGGRFCSLQRYNGLWYNKTEDDHIQLPTTISAEVENEEEQVRAAFKDMLKEASKNYITVEGDVKLSELLDEYRDIFRIGLTLDPPAKVEPMEIRLKDDRRPVGATQRRYSVPKGELIENTIRRLENAGAVYHNPKAKWASLALAVTNQEGTGFVLLWI